jgi:prefoldin subunit 5
LAKHRQQLEQQLEDLQVTLAELGQHESRCQRLLADRRAEDAAGGRPTKPRKPTPVTR